MPSKTRAPRTPVFTDEKKRRSPKARSEEWRSAELSRSEARRLLGEEWWSLFVRAIRNLEPSAQHRGVARHYLQRLCGVALGLEKLSGKMTAIAELAESLRPTSTTEELPRPLRVEIRKGTVVEHTKVTRTPRHAVIVGTTNKTEFLADPTGNRRFWPIAVDNTIDLGKLAEWREQLWAEAVAAAKAGERWWLDEEEDRKLTLTHSRHEERHPWTEAVQAWLEGRPVPPVTTAAVLEHAVGKARGQWNRADEMTVAAILRHLGYDRPAEARLFDAEGQRVRAWVRVLKVQPTNLTIVGN
jgi:hypothetical protein